MNKEYLIIKLEEVLASDKSNLSEADRIKIKAVIEMISAQKLTKAQKLEILFAVGRFATEIAPDIWKQLFP